MKFEWFGTPAVIRRTVRGYLPYTKWDVALWDRMLKMCFCFVQGLTLPVSLPSIVCQCFTKQ